MQIRVAHASRVLVLASRRNNLSRGKESIHFSQSLRQKKTGKFPQHWAEQSNMKLFVVILAALCLNCGGLFAQGKIDLQLSDSIHDILERNVGQTLELRLKSGEKIGGKVAKLGDKLVFLSGIAGAEFYDAAVEIGDVAAVVVRVRNQ
jgi:hypothetical protein